MSDFGTFLKIQEIDNNIVLNTPYFTVTFRSTESMYCKSIYDKSILEKVLGKEINRIYITGKRGFRRFEDDINIYKNNYAYPENEAEGIVIYAGRHELKIGVLGSLYVDVDPVKPS